MIQKNASVKFIFITILLDAIGIGLIIPILPDVIRRFSADSHFVNQYYGYFISVYAFMQFIASPFLGSLSDRFGRRSILLISLMGAGLDYLLMAFAPNLAILFLGRVIAGLTGASMTVATSYMADISDDKNRAANFGMIGAAFGFGFIAGPLLGGLLGTLGPSAPFIGAATLSLMNWLFGLFVLPESLPVEKRRHLDIKRMNPFASLIKVVKPSPTLVLIFVFFFFHLAGNVHPSVWTLYTQHKLKWSTFEVGLSLTFVGIMVAIVQGGLTRILIPKWGESRSIVIGSIFYMLGFVSIAFATQSWMLYAILFISSIANIVHPSLHSVISRDTPTQEQGELQGSLMSLISLASILAPLLYTWLFAHFTNSEGSYYFPGAPYVGAGIISFLAILLFVRRRNRQTA